MQAGSLSLPMRWPCFHPAPYLQPPVWSGEAGLPGLWWWGDFPDEAPLLPLLPDTHEASSLRSSPASEKPMC